MYCVVSRPEQKFCGSSQAASDRFRSVSTGLVTAISSSQTPLWLLGFQCVGSAAAALCSAIVLSQKLHKAADRAESGEVRCLFQASNRLGSVAVAPDRLSNPSPRSCTRPPTGRGAALGWNLLWHELPWPQVGSQRSRHAAAAQHAADEMLLLFLCSSLT